MGAHVSPLLFVTLKFAAIKCLIQSFSAEIIIIISNYQCMDVLLIASKTGL